MRYLLLSLLSAVTIGAAWLVITTLHLGIPPMPSTRKLRTAVVGTLSDLPAGTRVVDIGSGWGGLVRRIAQARPDLVVEGYERSSLPFLFSRLALSILVRRRGASGSPRIRFGDFRESGPGDGVCYITYLSPDGMKWIRAVFEKHLPRGGRLVSVVFAVRGWTPARTVRVGDMHRSIVYVYDL